MIVVILVALAAVCAATYWAEDLQGMYHLRVWNKAAPRAAVDAFVQALRASDQAAVQELCLSQQTLRVEHGKIMTLKPTAEPQTPPVVADSLLPTVSASDSSVTMEYDYKPSRRFAKLELPAEAGGIVTFLVAPSGGEWKIRGYSGRMTR
jgi:hypothetical protein